MIRQEAKEQTESGAHVLDVNVGVPGIDEISAMTRAVFIVNENTSCPIVIDSADPKVIEAGLKACDGKPLINSVSGEEKNSPLFCLSRKNTGPRCWASASTITEYRRQPKEDSRWRKKS